MEVPTRNGSAALGSGSASLAASARGSSRASVEAGPRHTKPRGTTAYHPPLHGSTSGPCSGDALRNATDMPARRSPMAGAFHWGLYRITSKPSTAVKRGSSATWGGELPSPLGTSAPIPAGGLAEVGPAGG